MAFQKVVDLDADNCTALGGLNKKTGKPNPKTAEGYYLGSKEVDSPKSKSGKAYLHILQTEDGNLGVWGKTDLDRKLKQVKAGEMIRITQSGKQATKNGDMYKFTVEVDKENTIEVAFPEAEAAEHQDTDSYSDEGEESDVDGEEEQPDEVPPARTARTVQAATPPSASQQAKVAALLSKSRQKSA